MDGGDLESLYSYHPESSSDYFDDPFAFWKSIPFGEDKPSEFFMRPLGTTLGLGSVPAEARAQVLERHPIQVGTDYHVTELPNSDLLSITVKTVPTDNPTILQIPGLVVDSARPDLTYPWQTGLTEALGYYFYNTTNKLLTSFEDIARNVTEKAVRFYFYGPGFEQLESLYVKIPKFQGDYYAIILANPKSISNILGRSHEFGHVVWDENYPTREQKLLNESGFENQIVEFVSRSEDISATSMTDEARNSANSQLNKDYYASKAYRSLKGVEMMIEYEAWKKTLPLMKSEGLMPIFEGHSEELLHYIFWTIKTRMYPVTSY